MCLTTMSGRKFYSQSFCFSHVKRKHAFLHLITDVEKFHWNKRNFTCKLCWPNSSMARTLRVVQTGIKTKYSLTIKKKKKVFTYLISRHFMKIGYSMLSSGDWLTWQQELYSTQNKQLSRCELSTQKYRPPVCVLTFRLDL